MLMAPPDSASELIAAVCDRLERGQRVRRRLPAGGGRLHIDRGVPFLCLHRQPGPEAQEGAERFVTAQASYLQAGAQDAQDPGLGPLVGQIARQLAGSLGGFLLVEVWEEASTRRSEEESPAILRPGFTVVVGRNGELDPVVEAFSGALERVRLGRQRAWVRREARPEVAPPGLAPLLADTSTTGSLGIAVEPVYRGPRGELFALVLQRLEEQLREALERGLFAFSRLHTHLDVADHRALGRRTLAGAAWNVDRRLEAVNDSFDFLLQVTPVDTERAWERFEASAFGEPPTFHYRPLPFDPHQVKRDLFGIPIERVEDPVLSRLFREKQEELDRRLSLLMDRGTPRFLLGNLLLYGVVEGELLRLAERLLARLAAREPGGEGNGLVDAASFARAARREIGFYHQQMPTFRARIQIRSDIAAAVMVSRDQLLVARGRYVPAQRVEALLHHEVGTHLLTYFNGKAQRIRLFHCGLAGYETLQEGIAVLAEYLAGGLTASRLRTLAARVVACHALVEGASFVECFQTLVDEHGFPPRQAFFIVARVFRGGGLTKDAVYLRGLRQLVSHLQWGGELEKLLVGKIALRHLSAVEDLWHRDFFRPPAVLPRYLDQPEARRRLDRLRSGQDLFDILVASPRGQEAAT
jgi:uncharacterized protein (TIGR02421 family)